MKNRVLLMVWCGSTMMSGMLIQQDGVFKERQYEQGNERGSVRLTMPSYVEDVDNLRKCLTACMDNENPRAAHYLAAWHLLNDDVSGALPYLLISSRKEYQLSEPAKQCIDAHVPDLDFREHVSLLEIFKSIDRVRYQYLSEYVSHWCSSWADQLSLLRLYGRIDKDRYDSFSRYLEQFFHEQSLEDQCSLASIFKQYDDNSQRYNDYRGYIMIIHQNARNNLMAIERSIATHTNNIDMMLHLMKSPMRTLQFCYEMTMLASEKIPNDTTCDINTKNEMKKVVIKRMMKLAEWGLTEAQTWLHTHIKSPYVFVNNYTRIINLEDPRILRKPSTHHDTK